LESFAPAFCAGAQGRENSQIRIGVLASVTIRMKRNMTNNDNDLGCITVARRDSQRNTHLTRNLIH